MAATYAKDGALDAAQGGNDTGAASTGIGVGSGNSGQGTGNFTSNPGQDFLPWHIGGANNDAVAPSSVSASNTGQVLNPPVTVTAGSGYNNGTYLVQSTGGGALPGAGAVEFTIAGGALVSARVVRAGSGFTSNPTWTLANAVNVNGSGIGVGAGTLGALLTAVGLLSQGYMLGAGFGLNKNTARNTAAGAVAINGVVTPGTYINRSGRALVAGDQLWAVEP